jgi:hypothetical protein
LVIVSSQQNQTVSRSWVAPKHLVFADTAVNYTGWWFNHLEKYGSQMGRIIPYIMEHKKSLKPPASILY